MGICRCGIMGKCGAYKDIGATGICTVVGMYWAAVKMLLQEL